MSNSVNQARAMVKALIKHGVRQVVIAPGSRNAPLTMALAQAASAELISLHTRIDERTAAFTALGLAKRQLRPVAVLTTSGTAATHLLAAAWEASEAGVPLLLLTADRPPSVRDRGANQTILQAGLFGEAVRAEWDLPLAVSQDEAYWELAVAGAIAASMGDEFTAPGAVHLNIPFAEPLVPEVFDDAWLTGVTVGELTPAKLADEVSLAALLTAEKLDVNSGLRGVVICSDPHSAIAARNLALSLGWPLLAEPGSNAAEAAVGVPDYATRSRELLDTNGFAVDVVVTAGRFGLSRSTNELVKTASVHIAVGKFPLDADPFESAKHHVLRMPDADIAPATSEWLELWQSASENFNSDEFDFENALLEVSKVATNQDLVWFAASKTVRVTEKVWPLTHKAMQLMNRGTNGIDGLIASATGAALVHGGRTFLLMGDVAFLHDVSSLMLPSTEKLPDLTIVVFNNHEGAIFHGLEQGAAQYEAVYAKVFGTPQQHDLVKAAEAANWKATKVSSLVDLNAALQHSGPNVVVVEL